MKSNEALSNYYSCRNREVVGPVLYNNGNETRDFVDCIVKIRQNSREYNETPLNIKPESVLVPFSEYIGIWENIFLIN